MVGFVILQIFICILKISTYSAWDALVRYMAYLPNHA